VVKIIGKEFKVDMKHEVDKELVELIYKAINPTTVKLTEIAIKYDKDPEEVLEKYKKIQRQLLK